jgi:hypothetical protein
MLSLTPEESSMSDKVSRMGGRVWPLASELGEIGGRGQSGGVSMRDARLLSAAISRS